MWLGLEGRQSAYAKFNGTDTQALVQRLQGLGIRVLGSSIIGLAEHGADNIDAAIDHAVAHDTEFHQFHGQLRFNYRHPRIRSGEETEYLLRAFRRDFERNGPSVTRIARTLLRGWRALKDHPDPRVRRRVAARLRATLRDVESAFGWTARVAARVVGPVVLATLWREDRRLRRGVTYEPPTFYEANPAAAARPEVAGRGAAACGWVEPPARPAADEAVA